MLAIGLLFLAESRLAHPHLHEVRAVSKRIHKYKLIYVELTRRVLQTTWQLFYTLDCYLALPQAAQYIHPLYFCFLFSWLFLTDVLLVSTLSMISGPLVGFVSDFVDLFWPLVSFNLSPPLSKSFGPQRWQ